MGQGSAIFEALRGAIQGTSEGGALRWFQPTDPTNRIGEVGLSEPDSFSMVIANAFAVRPSGIFSPMIIPFPCSSGLNMPAGMGAPVVGIIHSSYAFPAGAGRKLVAMNISRFCEGLKIAVPVGC